jgi:hypothetical protein
VFTASFHGSLDPLAPCGGDTLRVEDGQRHFAVRRVLSHSTLVWRYLPPNRCRTHRILAGGL